MAESYANASAGFGAVDNRLPFRPGHLRQRVQFHALIKRCSGDASQIVAEGFATGFGAAHVTVCSTRRIGCRGSECLFVRSDKLSVRSRITARFVSGRNSS